MSATASSSQFDVYYSSKQKSLNIALHGGLVTHQATVQPKLEALIIISSQNSPPCVHITLCPSNNLGTELGLFPTNIDSQFQLVFLLWQKQKEIHSYLQSSFLYSKQQEIVSSPSWLTDWKTRVSGRENINIIRCLLGFLQINITLHVDYRFHRKEDNMFIKYHWISQEPLDQT